MNKNNNYNELRQIRKEDNKVIYYQLLEKVIEERKQVPNTIKDFEEIGKSYLLYRCYDCAEPFLSLPWKDNRREHLVKVFVLCYGSEDSEEIRYYLARCCKCSDECDCQEWIKTQQKEWKEKVDRVKRELKTMEKIKNLLEKEFENVQHQEEKELIRSTIDWNVGDRYIKEKQQTLKNREEKLSEINYFEESFQQYKKK